MSQLGKLIGGAAQVLTGHGAIQVLGFARNIAMARLISPEDFGVAATFAVTVSLLEAASDMALNKFLIQNRDGDDIRLQATLQTILLLRGALLAAVLFALAGNVANWFDTPEATLAYQWLALIPLIAGLENLDIQRAQRRLEFRRILTLKVLSYVAGVSVAIILAFILRDYTATLWGLIAQTAFFIAGTHVLAARPYRLLLAAEYLPQAFRFGWPLMIDGFLLVLAAQGDRILVGGALGVRELAFYSAACLLALAPGQLLIKASGAVIFPWLSRMQDDPRIVEQKHRYAGVVVSAVAILVFVPLMVMGMELVAFAFGADYRASDVLMGWLAFTGAMRMMRGWLLTAALAAGATKVMLVVNILRIATLPAAFAAIHFGGGLVEIAMAVCLVEVASFVYGRMVIVRRLGFERMAIDGFLIWLLATFFATMVVLYAAPLDGVFEKFLASVAIVACAFALGAATAPDLRMIAMKLLRFGVAYVARRRQPTPLDR